MKLRCPECRQAFPWDTKAKWPNYCPLCRADINNDRDDDDIVMPFVRSGSVKATDQLYRDMEKGSEVRAQIAAEQAGVPASEMASLKITDLKSATREGDIAAVPVSNIVTQHMEMMNARGGSFGYQDRDAGAVHAQGTATGAININGKVISGIAPRAGATALGNIQRLHNR